MRKIKYVLKRAVFRVSPALAERCGIDFRLNAPSRAFLENEVFGYVNRLTQADGGMKLLFLGLDKHNWHYPRLLSADFHSLDIKRANAAYGRPGRHQTGSALQMDERYGEGAFDAVVANGLLGFGVNTEADFRRLMVQCHWVLKPGGLLVLGYNNRPDRVPYPVTLQGGGMFDEFVPDIAGVQGARHQVDDAYRHIYVFARKSAMRGDAVRA